MPTVCSNMATVILEMFMYTIFMLTRMKGNYDNYYTRRWSPLKSFLNQDYFLFQTQENPKI